MSLTARDAQERFLKSLEYSYFGQNKLPLNQVKICFFTVHTIITIVRSDVALGLP